MKRLQWFFGLLIVLVGLGSQMLPVRADDVVTCNGVAPLTFSVNDFAKVSSNTKLANRIRSSPTLRADVVGTIPVGETFKIENATPACASDIWWWFVQYKGVRGWTAQGANGDTYIEFYTTVVTSTLVPTHSTSISTPVAVDYCARAPESTLIPGERGTVIVTNPPEDSIVLDVASLQGNEVFRLPPGAVFDVIRGPVCNDGIRWWRVRYRANGKVKVGWAADGLDGESFLAPAGPA